MTVATRTLSIALLLGVVPCLGWAEDKDKPKKETDKVKADERIDADQAIDAYTKRIGTVDLSDKQQRRLDRIVADAKRGYKSATTEEGKKGVLFNFQYRVTEYVLTEEQRTKLNLDQVNPANSEDFDTPKEITAIANEFKDLKLSERQQGHINSLVRRATKTLANSESDKDKDAVTGQLRDDIRMYVLTKSQRQQFDGEKSGKKKAGNKKSDAAKKRKGDDAVE